MRSGPAQSRTEAGVATIAAATTVGLLLLVAAVLVQVGLVVATKHRAQAAADLAALAGSAASLRGHDGCRVARTVARRNGADVHSCRADLAVVTLRTESSSAAIAGVGRFRAKAEARAAPDFYVPAAAAAAGAVEGASRRSRSSSRTAPDLSSGSLPLPHFGD